MADITTTTTSEAGFASTSRVGEFELSIDPGRETGPSPNESLVATYAACFLPAFRVGAQQRGIDDLGHVAVHAEADLDEDDDLTAIHFEVSVEAELDEDTAAAVVERAEEVCHVHTALRDDLTATVSVTAGTA